MYLDQSNLNRLAKELKGLRLSAIYPEWDHGIIYLRFCDTVKTRIVAVKNNYYAGMKLMEEACGDSDQNEN